MSFENRFVSGIRRHRSRSLALMVEDVDTNVVEHSGSMMESFHQESN